MIINVLNTWNELQWYSGHALNFCVCLCSLRAGDSALCSAVLHHEGEAGVGGAAPRPHGPVGHWWTPDTVRNFPGTVRLKWPRGPVGHWWTPDTVRNFTGTVHLKRPRGPVGHCLIPGTVRRNFPGIGSANKDSYTIINASWSLTLLCHCSISGIFFIVLEDYFLMLYCLYN